jgi:hypothetical protein
VINENSKRIHQAGKKVRRKNRLVSECSQARLQGEHVGNKISAIDRGYVKRK